MNVSKAVLDQKSINNFGRLIKKAKRTGSLGLMKALANNLRHFPVGPQSQIIKHKIIVGIEEINRNEGD